MNVSTSLIWLLNAVSALAWLSAAGCLIGTIVNFGRYGISLKESAGPDPRWFPLIYYPASRLTEAGRVARRKGLYFFAAFLASGLVFAGTIILQESSGTSQETRSK